MPRPWFLQCMDTLWNYYGYFVFWWGLCAIELIGNARTWECHGPRRLTIFTDSQCNAELVLHNPWLHSFTLRVLSSGTFGEVEKMCIMPERSCQCQRNCFAKNKRTIETKLSTQKNQSSNFTSARRVQWSGGSRQKTWCFDSLRQMQSYAVAQIFGRGTLVFIAAVWKFCRTCQCNHRKLFEWTHFCASQSQVRKPILQKVKQVLQIHIYIYMDIYDMYTVAVQRYTFLSQQTRCAMGAGSCWTWLRFMRQSAFDKDLSSFPLLSREHGRSVSRAWRAVLFQNRLWNDASS